MGIPIHRTQLAGFLFAVAASVIPGAATRADYSLSNNLSGTSGGVESATGTNLIAAGFGSGTTGGQLSSVTLSIAQVLSSTAEVDLYADDGLDEPGTKIAALTLSGSLSSTLANTTFTASNVTLAANTNYWVVLTALTGQINWSWNLSNTGTGTGYQGTWGESADSGADWFTYDAYPTEMNVVLASAATVPEPSTLVLWGLGTVGVVVAGRTRTRAAGRSPRSSR